MKCIPALCLPVHLFTTFIAYLPAGISFVVTSFRPLSTSNKTSTQFSAFGIFLCGFFSLKKFSSQKSFSSRLFFISSELSDWSIFMHFSCLWSSLSERFGGKLFWKAKVISRNAKRGLLICKNKAERFPNANPSSGLPTGANAIDKLYPRRAFETFPVL